MTSPKPEWESFVDGKRPAGDNDDWSKLENLSHGTHLTSAIRIAEDRMIAGGLIYDGKLRETRTEVVYFSPNYWADGSRYGSFHFEIPWASLIADRKIYWVESIRTYKIPIYRFLASRHDVKHLDVTAYDPTKDNGPLRQIGADWYWARNWAAEIIVDEAIPLDELSRLKFEKHHDDFCSERRPASACGEKAIGGSHLAQARFLACLLGRPLMSLNDLLVEGGDCAWGVSGGISQLWWKLGVGLTFGGPIADDAAATDQIRAACLFLHAGDRATARKAMAQIDTEERADRIMLEMIRSHFKLPAFEW